VIGKLAMALGLAAVVLGVSACNTVRGAGDDLKSAADAVDRAI
jgi:entericidin B